MVSVLLPALLAPLVLLTAVASWQDNNNDLISWADDALPIKQQFREFVGYFGRPELIVATWPGCNSDSEQLAELARLFEDEPAGWFVNIATTKSVVERLGSLPGGLTESEIRSQLNGILVGPDNKQACLVAELGSAGRDNRPEAALRIKALAKRVGITSEKLKLGGMGPELAALDFESVAAPARLAPVIGLCMAVLCVGFLRSLQLGLFVTSLGGFTGILGAAIVHWCGVQSNAILATLPTLGGLLTISLSLHFIGYYRNARQEISDPTDALRQAYLWAWKPTLISAITTALGLGSLALSRTITIQQFGIFGAVITICAALLTLSVLPAFLRLAGARVVRVSPENQHQGWQPWVNFIQSNSKPAIAGVLLVAVILGAGLRYLKTGVHIDSMFVSHHEIIQDEHWLEANVGPLSTLEVVLSFPSAAATPEATASRLDMAKDIVLVRALAERIRSSLDFNSLVSPATGLPDIQQQRGVRRVAWTTRLRKWLNDNHEELLTSGFYAESETQRHWRISVRIPTLTDEATSSLTRKLQHHIDLYVEEQGDSVKGVDYFVTGIPLLFEQIEQQFIQDLLVTYIGGLILISLTVFVVLRSAADAATAMIPNVLPAVCVLGGISLLGIELDVGSVMTASIALGVAVDDTLHFVLWYQQQRRKGVDSTNAVRSAVLHCGAPILQTSVICGVGLAVLGVAPFLPTARFGLLIAMMLVVALVGDLLLLPAMLSIRNEKAPRAAGPVLRQNIADADDHPDTFRPKGRPYDDKLSQQDRLV